MAAVTSADSRCLYETSQSTGFKATASCLSADRRICNNLQSFINSSSQTSRVAPSWCSVLLWRPSRWQGPWKSPCQPPCSPQLGPSPPVRGRFLGTSLPWTCLWLRSSSPPLPRAAPQTASLGSRARRRGARWVLNSGYRHQVQKQTCKVMDEVFDEVADDGVKNRQHDEGSHEQVEDVGGQVNSIPRGGYVGLKQHRAIFLPVSKVRALHGDVHCYVALRGNPLNISAGRSRSANQAVGSGFLWCNTMKQHYKYHINKSLNKAWQLQHEQKPKKGNQVTAVCLVNIPNAVICACGATQMETRWAASIYHY